MRFNNLEAEFARIGMSPEKVGEAVGMSRQLMYNRLNGTTKWTLAEMVKVQNLVNTKSNANNTLDYLFASGIN